MTNIGEQIKTARKARGLTQDQLAELLHLSRQAISNYESGKRMPDGEMLLKLSDILEYSFENESPIPSEEASESASETPGDEEGDSTPAQEGNGSEKLSSAEFSPAESRVSSDSSRSSGLRKYILPGLAALALLVLACVGLATLLTPREEKKAAAYTDGNGKVYSIEDYKAVTPVEADKAYLSVGTELKTQQTSNGAHFLYTFVLREENGIGFTMERLEHVNFFYDGTSVSVDTFTTEDIEGWGDDPHIQPYGTYEMMCGINAYTPSGDPNAIGAGFQVWGTDDNGNALSFTAYLPLPVE